MDKKGVSILLKFIIGLIIAIMSIWVLLTVVDKLIIFGKSKQDSQERYFEGLNEKISKLNLGDADEQLFELKDNFLLVSFNEGGTKIDKTIIKKPPVCVESCLCLCSTEDDKYLFENDCLQPNDKCYQHGIKINDGGKFSLFKRGVYKLIIKRIDKNILIELESKDDKQKR